MQLYWWQPFFPSILRWCLTLVGLGLLSLPLSIRTAMLLPGNGLALCKPIGWVCFGFTAAWLSFLKICEPRLVFPVSILILFLMNLLILAMDGRNIWRILCQNRIALLRNEIIFFLLFLGYLWMRSFFADATYAMDWYGAEKWVNLGILTSIWRNPVIPPADPWLWGYSLNYYYFSHWVWAGLGRVSAIRPEVVFNLALATLFALQVMLAFCLGQTLSEKKQGGWWAVFFIMAAGPIVTWIQMPDFLDVMQSNGLFRALLGFDFWQASDVVSNTRNEFPAFHMLLGDLHAHGSGWMLSMLALCLMNHLQHVRELSGGSWRATLLGQLPCWVLLSVVMACVWATNGFDLAVLALLGLVWIVIESCRGACDRWSKTLVRADAITQSVQGVLIWMLVLILAIGVFASFYSRLTYFPLDVVHQDFLAGLPSVFGILGYLGKVDLSMATDPIQAIWFWAGLLLPLFWAGFLLTHRERLWGWNRPLPALLFALGLVCVLLNRGEKALSVFGLLSVFAALACFIVALRMLRRCPQHVALFHALVYAVAAFCCLAISEFVFLDDVIQAPFERYNTVFKLYYPVWGLLALTLSIVFAHGRFVFGSRLRWGLIAGGTVFFLGIYPVLGIASRIEKGRERLRVLRPVSSDAESACRTLDALAFMNLPGHSADDLALGLWIRENIEPSQGPIVEASLGSYNATGRFAVISGMPGYLGWVSHETQWRGRRFSAVGQAGDRLERIDQLYRMSDAQQALELCVRYRLRWVVVGGLERGYYSEQSLDKFSEIGRVVHQEGESVLFEIRMD